MSVCPKCGTIETDWDYIGFFGFIAVVAFVGFGLLNMDDGLIYDYMRNLGYSDYQYSLILVLFVAVMMGVWVSWVAYVQIVKWKYKREKKNEQEQI